MNEKHKIRYFDSLGKRPLGWDFQNSKYVISNFYNKLYAAPTVNLDVWKVMWAVKLFGIAQENIHELQVHCKCFAIIGR